MAKARKVGRRAPVLKRKSIIVDQQKLDAAKSALGVETEAEAVDAALEMVLRGDLFPALDRVLAEGGVAPRSGARTRR